MTGAFGASHAYSNRLPLLALPWDDHHHHTRPARGRQALLPDDDAIPGCWRFLLLAVPLDMEKSVG